MFRDGWSRNGDTGVPYESVLVSNELAFAERPCNGRLTELSKSRGRGVGGGVAVVDGAWSVE